MKLVKAWAWRLPVVPPGTSPVDRQPAAINPRHGYHGLSRAGPKVRIHLPPAESLQTLGSARGTSAGGKLTALFADRSHSIVDNLLALLGAIRDRVKRGPEWRKSSTAFGGDDFRLTAIKRPVADRPTCDASDAGLDAPAIQHDARALASEVTLAAGNAKSSFSEIRTLAAGAVDRETEWRNRCPL